MEVDQVSSTGPANDSASPVEVMDVTLPSPADSVNVNNGSKPMSKTGGKLSKNFSLSPTTLFMDLSSEEQEQALSTTGCIATSADKKKDDDEEFEMIERSSLFVAAAIIESQRSHTENAAPTWSSSGDPRIDFFFHVLEQTDPVKTIEMLKGSWKVNDLHTLQLIAALRDIKDGKGIRRQYQYCLYWLYTHHPKTLFENLPVLLELGYWKDGLHLLMTICFGGFIHPYFAADDGVKDPTNYRAKVGSHRGRGRGAGQKRSRSSSASAAKNSGPRQRDSEKRLYNVKILEHYKINQPVHQMSSKQVSELRLRYAREQFASNLKYRAFHIRIAQLFARQLMVDFYELEKLNPTTADEGKGDTDATGDKEKKPRNINLSLVGKWAPTLEGHFDRYTMVASTIALEFAKLLNKDDILKKDSVAVAVYLARKFYNKSACIPLRTHLEIPETFMSRNEWNAVNYARVSAKCMKLNKDHFIRHDEVRFEAYLKKDDAKVAGATLKPIDIIKAAMSLTSDTSESERLVTEKQWISLATDIKTKGGSLLSDAISVCDVSGSMDGDPMLAAMGLTLLTMNMSSPPWADICITFDDNPQIHHLDSSLTLAEKVNSLQNMPWGGSTNLQAVFTHILQIGIKNKLPAEEMPKILFIFTDMEFNVACSNSSLTNFEHAKAQFLQHNYNMPTIVFWNLRDAPGKTSTPVRTDERGTILLSGWSGQLLSFIMSLKDIASCTPWTFVQELVSRDKYKGLKIYD